jgi:hypothetical protein
MKKKILLPFFALFSLLLFYSCTVYEVRHDRIEPDYYTLRIYDNRYVYYRGDEAVAVWTFGDDGVCIKEGIMISGPVRVYYQPDVLFAETYYVNGIRDGVCKYYYPTGGVMYSGYYRGGYMSGSWTSYHEGGGVSASLVFHGTETQMPANFAPASGTQAGTGFNSMQMESSYAGKKAVEKPFNKEAAVPGNFKNSFGYASPGGVRPQEQNVQSAGKGTASAQEIKPNKPANQQQADNNAQPTQVNVKKHGNKQPKPKNQPKPSKMQGNKVKKQGGKNKIKPAEANKDVPAGTGDVKNRGEKQ